MHVDSTKKLAKMNRMREKKLFSKQKVIFSLKSYLSNRMGGSKIIMKNSWYPFPIVVRSSFWWLIFKYNPANIPFY